MHKCSGGNMRKSFSFRHNRILQPTTSLIFPSCKFMLGKSKIRIDKQKQLFVDFNQNFSSEKSKLWCQNSALCCFAFFLELAKVKECGGTRPETSKLPSFPQQLGTAAILGRQIAREMDRLGIEKGG